MSSKLREQLLAHGEHWGQRLHLWRAYEVVDRRSPMAARATGRRIRPLPAIALSALAVLALIGGALLLLRPSPGIGPARIGPAATAPTWTPVAESPVTQPPATEPPVTPVPTTTVAPYDADAVERYWVAADQPPPTTKAPVVSPIPNNGPFARTHAIYVGTAIYDVATTPGWVWTVGENGLHRIDPATGAKDTTIDLPRVPPDHPVGYKATLEVGAGALWITHGAVLSRVNPETATVTGTIELDTSAVNRPLAVDGDAVWVADGGRVLRIDPDDLQVAEELRIAADALVVGADSVWVLTGGRVTRIDAATTEILASIPLSGSVGYPSIGTPMTFGQGAVWVSNAGLTKIDPATNQVSRVYSDPNCCAVVVGFVGDYILAYGLDDSHGTVIVDPENRQLERVFTSGSAVFAIHGDTDGFWAMASRSAMLYRYELRTDVP